MLNQNEKNALVQYCLDFYGPEGMHADFFKQPVTEERLRHAIEIVDSAEDFEADVDSVTREFVRDVMLHLEDQSVEYFRVIGWINKYRERNPDLQTLLDGHLGKAMNELSPHCPKATLLAAKPDGLGAAWVLCKYGAEYVTWRYHATTNKECTLGRYFRTLADAANNFDKL